MYNAENEKHQSCGAKLGWKYECISPAVQQRQRSEYCGLRGKQQFDRQPLKSSNK